MSFSEEKIEQNIAAGLIAWVFSFTTLLGIKSECGSPDGRVGTAGRMSGSGTHLCGSAGRMNRISQNHNRVIHTMNRI
ncbi:MAG: hypothetical protein ACE5DN_01015 [Flavobacteriales bacterium]